MSDYSNALKIPANKPKVVSEIFNLMREELSEAGHEARRVLINEYSKAINEIQRIEIEGYRVILSEVNRVLSEEAHKASDEVRVILSKIKQIIEHGPPKKEEN